MDYIKQLNAFGKLSIERALPATATAIYLRLFLMDNQAGWAEWFSTTDFRLMFETSLGSRNTISSTRNILKQKGFIDFVSKGKRSPVKYKLIDLVNCSNSEHISEQMSEHISEQMSEHKSEHLFKQETKKQEKHKKSQPEPSGDVHLIVARLNEEAGTSYNASTSKTKSLIQARLKEGFSLSDFSTVIEKKCREWRNTDMAKYLRPETLFGTKFESYLNQPEAMQSPDDDYFSKGGFV